MVWHVRAARGREMRYFTMDEDAAALTPETRAPGTYDPPDKTELGRAGALAFTTAGDGPSFDLRVEDTSTGRTLVITETHITARHFGDLPNLDSVVVVSGDSGTSTSRRMMLIGLQQLRDKLDEGAGTMPERDLDYARIQGAVNGIDLDLARINFFAVGQTPEVAVIWNVPRANPAKACLKIFHFSGYEPGREMVSLYITPSRELVFDGFWAIRFDAAYDAEGILKVAMVGVGRKRREFCLCVQTLSVNLSSTTLQRALTEVPFNPRMIEDIKLRDNDGIKALAALPQGRGVLVATENPTRKRFLYRVDLSDRGVNTRVIEGVDPPRALWIDSAPPPAPEAEPEAEEAGAGEAEGLVVVGPEGASISLGERACDSDIWAQVYAVGEGAGARLLWWISQSGAEEGQSARFTLHFEAAREIKVRYILFEE